MLLFCFFTNGASFVDIFCSNMFVFAGIQKHLSIVRELMNWKHAVDVIHACKSVKISRDSPLHSLFVWLRSMPAGDAFFFIPIPTPLLLFNGQNCHVLKRIPAPQSSSVISISGSSMGGGWRSVWCTPQLTPYFDTGMSVRMSTH